MIDAYCILTTDPYPDAQNDCTDVMRFAKCGGERAGAPPGCEEGRPYARFEALADDGQSAQQLCVAEGQRKFECTYIVARVDVCRLSETEQQCMCADPDATDASCADHHSVAARLGASLSDAGESAGGLWLPATAAGGVALLVVVAYSVVVPGRRAGGAWGALAASDAAEAEGGACDDEEEVRSERGRLASGAVAVAHRALV